MIFIRYTALCLFISILFSCFFSCATNQQQPQPVFTDEVIENTDNGDNADTTIEENEVTTKELEPLEKEAVSLEKEPLALSVVFAGDIMAHEENFSMKKPFGTIWTDIEKYVKDTDLAFANIEAPVVDEKDWQSYPTFNMKSEYVEEVIKTGFNVFSLANNHTNDQGVEGMKATYAYFKAKEAQTKDTDRPIYSAGVKPSADSPLTYQVIEKDGWKVLFVAVTEVLNSFKGVSYIDYASPTSEARAGFVKKLARLREENPVDLFVLSIHCAEPEYVRTVMQSQRDFYYKLIQEARVDVVWANHPHVAKGWDIVGNLKSEKLDKMVMYALGNTISGQRRDPQFTAPETARDYTGDGYLIRVKFTKKYNAETGSFEKCEIASVNPVLITTYIDSDGDYILKELNPSLIKTLKSAGDEKWASYLEKRMKLMENTKGTIIWQ